MNYLLTVREGGDGRQVVPARLMQGDGLGTLDELKAEQRLTFLVHGFNVSADSGRDSLLSLARELSHRIDGGLVAVLWPGDHWAGPLSYSFEGRDADDSAFQLSRFIKDHTSTEVTLNFVAHSMGSRVVMETVAHLDAAGWRANQVCLMAAAIDDDSLSDPAVYNDEMDVVERIAVLYSREDEVLKYAYPIGDLFQAFLFWRDSVGSALGRHGPKRHRRSRTPVPNGVIKNRIPNHRGADHGDYLPSEPMNREKMSAARYAGDVLLALPSPRYP